MMPSTSTVHLPNRSALRQAISRARRTADRASKPDQVEVPKDLKQVIGQQFLGRDERFGQEGILLFSTKDLRNLREAPYWIIDDTPYMPWWALTAAPRDLVYGLLSSKLECYELFFSSLMDYALEFDITLAPLFIITDFERVDFNAGNHIFLSTTHKGGFFHLGQNIWWQIQSCRLATQYGEDEDFQLKLKQLQFLAFLPVDKILYAFMQLKDTMPQLILQVSSSTLRRRLF